MMYFLVYVLVQGGVVLQAGFNGLFQFDGSNSSVGIVAVKQHVKPKTV